MVSFAKKATNIRTDVEKKAGGNAGWMRGVKDGKDLRVRFLQDPEEWLQYEEHYVRSSGFFPCTGDDTCGACASEEDRTKRASTKYVAQVLIQAEVGAKDLGQVKALKIPRPLANRLIARADRNGGTLLNRDYTIIRRGNGLDTEYDVESEDKAPLDLAKYSGQWADVGAILEQQFEENALPSPISRPVIGSDSEAEPRKSTTPTIDKLMEKSAKDTAEQGDEPPF